MDMRKIVWILTLSLVLCGCGAQETMETVADEMVVPVLAEPREIFVALPEDSALPVMESENGTLYICRDYDVMIQTVEAGDLDETVRRVSGFGVEDLTVIETGEGELDRYEFVWTSAGELGQQIGRATILDDGTWHYVLSATMDAKKIGEYQEVWNGIFESFSLVSY
jgi:hypothetical protein